MSVVMKIVFSLSLSGSLLILVLFSAKPLFKNRFSRQWQYYIWLVVIARLLLPVASETSIVGGFFAKIDQMNRIGHVTLQGTEGSVTAGDDGQVFPMEEDIAIQYQESGQSDSRTLASGTSDSRTSTGLHPITEKLLQNLWIPWLVAALLLLIHKITLYQSFVRYIKAGHKEVSDTILLDRLAQIGEQAGVRRPVELYVNSLVSSPLLVGFFHPCIILPTADLTEKDFTYTVWHELIHFKRKDMFYKWLVQLTICLHWFNPLVWLMEREINRACEFSCDEAVLGMLGGEERRAYGDTLFRALETGGIYKDFPVSVTLNESAELLKERLEAIMGFKKSSRMIVTVSIVLTVVMMMGATAVGAYVEPVRTVRITTIAAKSMSSQLTQIENSNDGSKNDSNIMTGNQSILDNKKSSEDLAEYWAEQEDARQYQEWGITRNGQDFYYQNQLVRVFFDEYDGENVIRTLQWNPAGTVDVKVTRSIRNKIISVAYMTEEEVTELFDTEDLSDGDVEEEYESGGVDLAFPKKRFAKEEKKEEEFDPENDVYRLTMEELPEDVCDLRKDNGEIRTWYVYHVKGRQYLCCKGFAWSYGYQLAYDENGWQINIQRFQKTEYGDVLLSLPDNGQITVYCDGQEITLTEIENRN